MEICEVRSKKEKKQFFDIARQLYRDDSVWVCPLDSQIESIFDPGKNSSFNNGDARRWILKDDTGELIGRIAGFFNRDRTGINKQPTGGIGFFECINNQDAANLLFDTAHNWLRECGMKVVDGPVNFGANDSFWGLLVEGFTHPGFGMPYNKPYFQKLFETYGFRNYFDQLSYHLDISVVKEFPERFEKIVEWVSRKGEYKFRHFIFSETDRFVNDVVDAYNTTWASFKEDYIPLNPDDWRESLRKTKPFMDEELIWFAYHHDKPVAFFIILPDLNQILRHLNGRLTPWNILKFIYYKRKHEITRMRAMVAGVLPNYQNRGLESVIFKRLFEVFQRKPFYKEVELSWVGDFNPKMRAIYEAIGGKLAKKHITCRYMLDPKVPFKRYVDEIIAVRGEL
jgi:GNAT superfamily N-acetyltransferase